MKDSKRRLSRRDTEKVNSETSQRVRKSQLEQNSYDEQGDCNCIFISLYDNYFVDVNLIVMYCCTGTNTATYCDLFRTALNQF